MIYMKHGRTLFFKILQMKILSSANAMLTGQSYDLYMNTVCQLLVSASSHFASGFNTFCKIAAWFVFHCSSIIKQYKSFLFSVACYMEYNIYKLTKYVKQTGTTIF